MINELIFVYGSLLNTVNEFAEYLNNNARIYTTGKFKGKLYDIGEYPGAIADTEGSHYVEGSIFRLNNHTEALKILDDYEGFGTDQLQPNLFVRELLLIETDTGPLLCWVYLYNMPVNNLVQIIPGNYTDYLTKKE